MKMRLGKGWLSLTLSLTDIFGVKDFYIPDQICFSLTACIKPRLQRGYHTHTAAF